MIGLSETNVLRRGSFSIDLEALGKSGEDLRRIDSAANDILKEIERQIENYFDLLVIVQDGLTQELGISSRFVRIEKMKSSE